MKKEIKTIKNQKDNKFSLCIYWNSTDEGKDQNTIKDIKKILDLIIKKEGTNKKSVKILARYNFDLSSLENINDFYPTLNIHTMSVHGSKGLESDYIIVLNVSGGNKYSFPSKIEDDPILNLVATAQDTYEDAEERRLFYVALTRTKGTVFLLGDIYHKSIFIEELIKDFEDKIYFINDPKIKLINCSVCKKGVLKKRQKNESKDKFFYGCSNYPRCEYTERVHYCPKCESEMYKDIEKSISKCKNNECDFESFLCKKCNDYMIERNGPYGRFLGCMSFPQCDYKKNILV